MPYLLQEKDLKASCIEFGRCKHNNTYVQKHQITTLLWKKKK